MNSFFRKLALGLRGEDVKLFQDRLKKSGFDILADEINNRIFGGKIEDVIKNLQERSHLKLTRVADKQFSSEIRIPEEQCFCSKV